MYLMYAHYWHFSIYALINIETIHGNFSLSIFQQYKESSIQDLMLENNSHLVI